MKSHLADVISQKKSFVSSPYCRVLSECVGGFFSLLFRWVRCEEIPDKPWYLRVYDLK